MSSVLSNSSSETITSKPSNSSINENKTYITDTLNNWYENNKSKFNLSQFPSLEGQHYFISIQNDSSAIFKDHIKYCCKKWVSLTLRRGKFQMSNFYCHLEGLCHALDNVSQQASSPNLILTIPLSVIIPLNSTLSTSSSISISTVDDESIRKQASSLA